MSDWPIPTTRPKGDRPEPLTLRERERARKAAHPEYAERQNRLARERRRIARLEREAQHVERPPGFCVQCGAPLPLGSRIDRIYCGNTCRVRRSRWKSYLRGG